MTTPTLDSFFSGGGGKSVSWKDKPVGTSVTGTIKTVNPPQQQKDPATDALVFKKDGVTPKMSVRIDLQTSERDPSDSDDDGTRSLYVQGWMQGAIGDALRNAGRQGAPEVGATLTVTLTAREPNATNPKLNPTNKFSAVYVPPSAAATGQFFEQPAAVPTPNISGTGYVQPPGPARPANIPEAAWNVMDAATRAAVAASAAPAAPAEPAKPDQIAQDSWDAMDPSTKAAVAATFAGLGTATQSEKPPF